MRNHPVEFVEILPARLELHFLTVENSIAKEIVDVAYRVHTGMGPGLLESVYEAVMEHELKKRGLRCCCQFPVPVVYEDLVIETGFRADMIVENKVIVEIKSLATLAPVHSKQLLTYLRLTGLRLGLLINFNVLLIKDGIRRIANGLPE